MQATRFLIAVVALCCLFQDGQAVQQTWRMGLIGEGSTIIGKAGTIGQQLVFDCEVTRNGKKFERYGWCSTVQIDSKRGSWMLCTMETYFPEGSVMNQVGHEGYGIGTLMLAEHNITCHRLADVQGTFFFKDMVFKGTTAIVGGTGKYVGATGHEALFQNMMTEPPSGNATMVMKY